MFWCVDYFICWCVIGSVDVMDFFIFNKNIGGLFVFGKISGCVLN